MKSTSIEAYKDILPLLPEKQKQVLSGLLKIKKGTFRQIAKSAGTTDDTAWKRLSELRTKGLVLDSKTTKDEVSGKTVTLWELSINTNK